MGTADRNTHNNNYNEETVVVKKKSLFLRFLYNSAITIFFIVVLVAAYFIPEIAAALMFAFFFYFLLTFGRLLKFKSRPPYLITVSAIAMIAFLILLFFKHYTSPYIKYGALFFEAIFVFALWILSFFRKKVSNWFILKGQMKNLSLSIRLNEFFLTTKLYCYIFTIHLIIVYIYKYFMVEYQTPGLDRFLFWQLNLSIVIIITIYEYIRIYMLNNEMKTENWLPVVNESGNVIGKVAYSVSVSSEKRFIHPVVRIALIHNNLLYLSRRDPEERIEPDKLDFPFESFVHYGNTLDETVNKILHEKVGFNDLPVKFIFKHIYKHPLTHRLIHLYTVQIPNIQQAGTINFTDGKWWTEKQIEENLDKGVFSDFFIMEYEILKNTILLANRTIQNANKEKND